MDKWRERGIETERDRERVEEIDRYIDGNREKEKVREGERVVCHAASPWVNRVMERRRE